MATYDPAFVTEARTKQVLTSEPWNYYCPFCGSGQTYPGACCHLIAGGWTLDSWAADRAGMPIHDNIADRIMDALVDGEDVAGLLRGVRFWEHLQPEYQRHAEEGQRRVHEWLRTPLGPLASATDETNFDA